MIFLIPYAIPTFISAISWRFMFLKDWGLINYILVDKLHLLKERPFWLVGDNSLYAIITAQVWRGWSFHFIMILAAMQTIQKDLYEAVDIDGGGKWAKFTQVTYPAIKPVLITLLVVNGLRILNEFETAFVMLGESPSEAANVISLHVYTQAFVNWNFGLGSAIALIWLGVILVLAFLLMKLTNMYKRG
ncbi:sugar ABC transporter permease [Paenibacillus sp. PL2-23]|uniref:carbohydrate ABC transporter permease n=1 Tax=Paenibacillus sp. PL2-23 TaxID=2100729 RepID=UPI0030FC89CF